MASTNDIKRIFGAPKRFAHAPFIDDRLSGKSCMALNSN
jgi:hypothetical protein